jgi:hypothetical protein
VGQSSFPGPSLRWVSHFDVTQRVAGAGLLTLRQQVMRAAAETCAVYRAVCRSVGEKRLVDLEEGLFIVDEKVEEIDFILG